MRQYPFYLIASFIVLCDVVQRLFPSKHRLQIKQDHLDKLSNLELTSNDWIMLSQLHGILQPFFHPTRATSGRRYPTIGIAYYLIVRLKIFLQNQSKNGNPFPQRLKQLLLNKLLFYFENDEEQLNLLKVS